MNKQGIILCDGGLGNRINGLVGGLATFKQANITNITICWPLNNWCECSFSNLFNKFDLNVIELGINELFEINQHALFLMHENQTNLNIHQLYAPTELNLTHLQNNKLNTVIYYNSLIPNFLNFQEISTQLQQLKIQSDILNERDSFLQNNSITKNTNGIHLRKTDFNCNYTDEIKLKQLITTNCNKQFFVCSDDQTTEQSFLTFDNVIATKKTEYVKKLIEGTWNELIVDNQGRQFNFNVYRTAQSVKEAFIDLLILANTNIITNTNSTFLNVAKLYSYIN